MAQRTIGPSEWGDDDGWDAGASRGGRSSVDVERRSAYNTTPPKLNPFHLLTQSQSEYAAALPPPSKAGNFLTRSPPSHPPPQMIHVHKMSDKNGVELVAGPGPGERDIPASVKRAGKKALRGFRPGKQESTGPPALSTESSLENRFVAPPSPPPSDAGSMTSSDDETDGESDGKVPGQPYHHQPQPNSNNQTVLLPRPSAADAIITPPNSHFTSSPTTSDSTAGSSGDVPLSPDSLPSSSALLILAPPLAPLPSQSDQSPLPPSNPSESISLSYSPDDLTPLPTQSEIRTRKGSLSSGGILPGGGGGRLTRDHSSSSSTDGGASAGYFDAHPSSSTSTPAAVPPPSVSSLNATLDTIQPATFANTSPKSTTLSPDHLHPSSARLQAPSGPLRRNTTGSPVLVDGVENLSPLSPSARASSLSRSPSVSPSAPPSSFPSQHPSRRASSPQTIVPGTDGAHLDSDILAQAEVIRKERLSRRARRDEEDAAAAKENEGSVQLNPAAGPSGQAGVGLGRKSIAANREIEEARVLVGNLIGEDHVNYVLMYNMLTGIRIGVSRCQAKNNRSLTAEDFSARHKFSFDIVGNELTPSARYDFKFKDYAPWVFRDLRDTHFHLDAADYLLSLTAKYILSELGSPGKSGSFFYFSRDYRFIIKTISHTEHKFLRSILPDYHAHIKSNPHTLLSRFYGLHRVKLPRGRKIHFVIMNNLFPPHRDIHETYDLKGSSVGREYPEEKARTKKGAVMKDINWVRRDRKIKLGPEKAALFAEQLRRDTEFLKRNRIMDYSLLIGIHNMERGNRDGLRQQSLQVFDPKVNTPSRRKPSSIKASAEASAVRQAVQRSDPRTLGQKGTPNHLSESDVADRKHFLFYQDEGGLRATNEANEPLDQIYYLGVIDICTPYSCVKKIEHVWKSLSDDRHGISAVPPPEYGDRFLQFLLSILPGSDREPPHSLRIQDIPDAADHEGQPNEHVRHSSPRTRLQEV